MKWFNIYKDGTPNADQRVLTYSEVYKGKPKLAFRILDGQSVKMCCEITHYMYLREPEHNNAIRADGEKCPHCNHAPCLGQFDSSDL